MLDEAEFRKQVHHTFSRIAAAFESVDPDIAECEQAAGAMTLSLKGRPNCILSTQPALRQIWLAVASRGIAYHFSFEPTGTSAGQWLDDKGQGIELLSFVRKHVRETVGIDVALG